MTKVVLIPQLAALETDDSGEGHDQAPITNLEFQATNGLSALIGAVVSDTEAGDRFGVISVASRDAASATGGRTGRRRWWIAELMFLADMRRGSCRSDEVCTSIRLDEGPMIQHRFLPRHIAERLVGQGWRLLGGVLSGCVANQHVGYQRSLTVHNPTCEGRRASRTRYTGPP